MSNFIQPDEPGPEARMGRFGAKPEAPDCEQDLPLSADSGPSPPRRGTARFTLLGPSALNTN